MDLSLEIFSSLETCRMESTGSESDSIRSAEDDPIEVNGSLAVLAPEPTVYISHRTKIKNK